MFSGRARTGPGRRGTTLVLVLAGILAAIAVAMYGSPKSQTRITGTGTMIRLYRVADHKTVTLPMEEYLIGAVAAEMPAREPLEALRAQAVAARSLVWYHLVPQSGESMPVQADISDDPGQGQPWISTRTMRRRWGWAYPFYYLKLADAVWSTRGEIATYGREPVDAVFFGGSGGHGTENAADIWGVDVPYLRRVAPVTGDRKAQTATYRFDLSTLDKLLAIRLQPDTTVRILSRTASGRPLVIQIGTSFMTASSLADRLNLPSSYFDLRLGDGGLTVTTSGYGNGVGMSQAGAEYMAAHGATWRQIIHHYYTGVSITHLSVPGA